MKELASSAASLMDALNPALQKLSETFCVSIDYIRENAMYYILEYGQYCWIRSVVWWEFWILLIFGTIAVIVYPLMKSDYRKPYTEDELKLFAAYRKYAPWPVIALALLVFGVVSFPYFMSPEMYSIQKVMELINTGVM